MTGDLPAAAVRLMAACSVLTHERRVYVSVQGSQNTRPIVIEGTQYESIKDVKNRLHISHQTVTNWLHSGKAKRL